MQGSLRCMERSRWLRGKRCSGPGPRYTKKSTLEPGNRQMVCALGSKTTVRMPQLWLIFSSFIGTKSSQSSGSEPIDSENGVHHQIRDVRKCIFFCLGSKTTVRIFDLCSLSMQTSSKTSFVLNRPTSSPRRRITLELTTVRALRVMINFLIYFHLIFLNGT